MLKVLKPEGSLVLDLGGGWTKGQPTKNLYEYELLLSFVDELNFNLAQDFLVGPIQITNARSMGNCRKSSCKGYK